MQFVCSPSALIESFWCARHLGYCSCFFCGLGLVGRSWFLVGLFCFDCVVDRCDCVGCFVLRHCVVAAGVGVGVVVVVADVAVVVAGVLVVAVVVAVVALVVALVVAGECRGCFFLYSLSKAEEEAVSLGV